MKEQTCGNCYFVRRKVWVDSGEKYYCHRHPPEREFAHATCPWPQVDPADWCGEYGRGWVEDPMVNDESEQTVG